MPSLTFDMDLGEWDVLLQRGNDALAELGKTVFQKCNPPSGAYAFFNHNAHAMTALQDCGRIMARLRVGRSRLTRLAHEEERLMPRDVPPGSGFPPEVQEVLRQSQDATEHMKLDFETLYMFGGILLDQWSLQAISIGDLKSARKYPFRELVDALDDNRGGALSSLWGRTKSDMLWLYYQLRFYRNRFIVHATRPWQRGTTMSVFGDDFDLFTPSPPGWLDDEALNAEIKGLLHLP